MVAGQKEKARDRAFLLRGKPRLLSVIICAGLQRNQTHISKEAG